MYRSRRSPPPYPAKGIQMREELEPRSPTSPRVTSTKRSSPKRSSPKRSSPKRSPIRSPRRLSDADLYNRYAGLIQEGREVTRRDFMVGEAGPSNVDELVTRINEMIRRARSIQSARVARLSGPSARMSRPSIRLSRPTIRPLSKNRSPSRSPSPVMGPETRKVLSLINKLQKEY